MIKRYIYLAITAYSVLIPSLAICQGIDFSQDNPFANLDTSKMTEEELIGISNQYIEYLAENDPGKLEALERMGQEMLASLDDAELEELGSKFGFDPQEIRQTSQQNEIAPPPIESKNARPQPQPSTTTEPTKKTTEEKVEKAPTKDAENAKEVIRTTLASIEELRVKEAASERIQSLLRTWDDDLTALTFFLKTLNKREHFLKIPLLKNGKIISLLSGLQEKLSRALPLIDPAVERFATDTYAFFDIADTESLEKLSTIYNQKRQAYNPDTIREKLTAQGMSDAQIQREIKSARIMQIALDEEYEKLADPKNQAEQERQRNMQQQGLEETYKQWKTLLSSITKEFGTLFFEEKILLDLEQYIKENEPEALKIKTAREKAIEEQKKLQEQRAKQAPTKTPGGSFEPKIQYKKTTSRSSTNNRYDSASGYARSNQYPYPYGDGPDYGEEKLDSPEYNNKIQNPHTDEKDDATATAKKTKLILQKRKKLLEELSKELIDAEQILQTIHTILANTPNLEDRQKNGKSLVSSESLFELASAVTRAKEIAQELATIATKEPIERAPLQSVQTNIQTIDSLYNQIYITDTLAKDSTFTQIGTTVQELVNISGLSSAIKLQSQPLTQKKTPEKAKDTQEELAKLEKLIPAVNLAIDLCFAHLKQAKTFAPKTAHFAALNTAATEVLDRLKQLLSITQQINSAELNALNQNILSVIKHLSNEILDLLDIQPKPLDSTLIELTATAKELQKLSIDAPDISVQNTPEVDTNSSWLNWMKSLPAKAASWFSWGKKPEKPVVTNATRPEDADLKIIDLKRREKLKKEVQS